MIGSVISHYKILDKLGEGGMGVVYKAHDTTLDRTVALKFLPQALTADRSERERFYQEARAASQLLHPNVTAIFEIGESEGQMFLAMEYVDGRTLSKLILDEEPLAVKKAIDLAIQMCTGLSIAHEKGIVHRDIKSENLLVNGKGELKITDLGLPNLRDLPNSRRREARSEQPHICHRSRLRVRMSTPEATFFPPESSSTSSLRVSSPSAETIRPPCSILSSTRTPCPSRGSTKRSPRNSSESFPKRWRRIGRTGTSTPTRCSPT